MVQKNIGWGFVLFCAFFFPLVLHAQIDLGATPFSIETDPAFPEPETTVTLRLVGNPLELTQSTVSWTKDGVPVASGPGLTKTSVRVGKNGSGSLIRVLVINLNGESQSTSVTLHPTEVDLVWSANSYTPPFFRGRALPSPGTTVAAEALPRFRNTNGTLLDPSVLIYTWRTDNSVLADVSGKGKRSVLIPAPPMFGSYTLSVTIETTDGIYRGQSSTRVRSAEPHLVLYRDHPLFGILTHTALDTSALVRDSEATFAAIPYYADAFEGTRSLSYEWFVNGSLVPGDPEDPERITIRTEEGSGIALIELALTHAQNWLQDARGKWNVTFDANTHGTIFNAE